MATEPTPQQGATVFERGTLAERRKADAESYADFYEADRNTERWQKLYAVKLRIAKAE